MGERGPTHGVRPALRALRRPPCRWESIILIADDSLLLTFLSNVVAYACRSSSRKDRHDVHQHRRLNRRGAIGGRRRYDAHGLPSARPWPSNERRKGRKGRKPRIRRKDGPCRRCREAAETGGNWRKLVF